MEQIRNFYTRCKQGVRWAIRAIVRWNAPLILVALFVLAYTMTPSSTPHCLIKRTTGYPCPGCGTTRSARAILEGDFVRAFDLNPLTPILIFCLIVASVVTCVPRAQKTMQRIGAWLTCHPAIRIGLYLLGVVLFVLLEIRQIRLGI